MRQIYLECGISKQGHYDDLQRELRRQTLALSYVGLMVECREIHPGMGLRTMYAQLCPEGIGRDAFIALGLREGFRLRVLPNAVRTTYAVKHCRYGNLLEGRRFRGVNQVWVSDLFYFTRFEKHLYVVLIMDAYSRRIVGYSAANNMRSENFLIALQRALTLRGVDDYHGELIHHSDRGSQYVSDAYTTTLEAYNIQISMCRDVLENAHAERVNGTIKNDYLARYDMPGPGRFSSFVDLAIESYNTRFHKSLSCTPLEYEIQLESISIEDRVPMEIFTINRSQIVDSSGQLDLFNDLSFN
jgi:transposase InsO family protein